MWIILKNRNGGKKKNNRRKRINNMIMVGIAVAIIGSIAAYGYSVEQTRLKGLQFGIEIERIQDEIMQLQNKFYSEKIKWEEGDSTKEDLLEFYQLHIDMFNKTISKYDTTSPPELFKSSVDLLKISSETQLQSDIQFIEWIRTSDASAKIRSDTLFQEAVNYEMQGLVEFYAAKTGVKTYDEPGQFEAPRNDITQMVMHVYERMKQQCDVKFVKYPNPGTESYLKWVEMQRISCIDEAEKWKQERLRLQR